MDKLLEATTMPNVTLQIAEFSTGHHPGGTYGPFVLFRFAVPRAADMVYSEYLTGGAVYFDARPEVAPTSKSWTAWRPRPRLHNARRNSSGTSARSCDDTHIQRHAGR